MKKFKICSSCKNRMPLTFTECEECGMSLAGLPILDEETIQMNPVNSVAEDIMVRVCEECGETNPANARKCSKCGEDISGVILTLDKESSTEKFGHMLVSLDGEYEFKITDESTIVGRECNMSEYLAKKLYVSRKHAIFTLKNEKLFVRNLSNTNCTFLNNCILQNDLEKELKDGDEVAFGGNEHNGNRQEQAAYFVVRINSCT